MRTETGAMVITRQVYRFDDGDLLISHGVELAGDDYGSTAIEDGYTKWDSGVPVGPMSIREPSDQS